LENTLITQQRGEGERGVKKNNRPDRNKNIKYGIIISREVEPKVSSFDRRKNPFQKACATQASHRKKSQKSKNPPKGRAEKKKITNGKPEKKL